MCKVVESIAVSPASRLIIQGPLFGFLDGLFALMECNNVMGVQDLGKYKFLLHPVFHTVPTYFTPKPLAARAHQTLTSVL